MDGRLGTNEDFTTWVKTATEAGIRVVVDGVFNHTGRDFSAFKNLMEQRRIHGERIGIAGWILTARALLG